MDDKTKARLANRQTYALGVLAGCRARGVNKPRAASGDAVGNAAGQKYYERLDQQRKLGEAALHSAGFREIGSGAFSTVFTHPVCPGYAFKVSWIAGDMTRQWAKFAVDNFGRVPCLPEIIMPKAQHSVWTCWMPLYETLEYNEDCDADVAYADAVDAYSDMGWRGGEAPLDDLVFEELDDSSPAVHAKAVALLTAIVAAHNEFAAYGSMDLHRGNVMVDPRTGELVLTDPLSFPNEGNDDY